jgi:hypothetical protein
LLYFLYLSFIILKIQKLLPEMNINEYLIKINIYNYKTYQLLNPNKLPKDFTEVNFLVS